MNRSLHVIGLSLTVLLHAGLAGLVFGAEQCGFLASAESGAEDDRFANARVIEAGLARKRVKPKNKQPQKQKKKKFKPKQGDKVTRDENAKPAEPKKNDVRVEPDEVDINSVLRKNRLQDDDLSDTGSDQVPVEGQEDGSEWGTEKDAVGDPYVGELKGRIYNVWKVPALETGSGRVQGCVKLDEDGKIVDRDVLKKSKNANLNRSVYLALRNAPNMEQAVPGHLKQLLTVNGICIWFNLDN